MFARYWRVRAFTVKSSSSAYFSLAELEFRAVAGGTSLTLGDDGAPIASGFFNNQDDHAPYRAFNGIIISDRWASAFGDLAAGNAWIGWDFIDPVEVREVVITARSETSADGQQITSGAVEYSTDGTNWVPIGTIIASSWPSSGSSQIFAVPENPIPPEAQLSEIHADVIFTSDAQALLSNANVEVAQIATANAIMSANWTEVAQVEAANATISSVWVELVHPIVRSKKRRPLIMP